MMRERQPVRRIDNAGFPVPLEVRRAEDGLRPIITGLDRE